MTVSIRRYGNQEYWNAGPSGGDLTPSQVLVDASSTSSVLSLKAYLPDYVATAVLQGNFQYDGAPSTMAHVSGAITSLTVYHDGVLTGQDSFTQAANLQQWLFSSSTQAEYLYQANILYQGINFVGSTATRAKWGDTLIGGSGKDSFTSYAGKITNGDFAYFDGKGSIDTAVFQGTRTQYTVASQSFTDQTDMKYQNQFIGYVISDSVKNRNGLTQVVNTERLSFTDGTLALDIAPGQNAGQAYRLYQAAFARTPDMPGVKYHLNDMESNGLALWNIASNFLASPEFATKYGSNPTDTQYINALYNNVLKRTPGGSEVAWYQNQFNTKAMDRQAALIGFSESPENVALVGSAIANGIWLG